MRPKKSDKCELKNQNINAYLEHIFTFFSKKYNAFTEANYTLKDIIIMYFFKKSESLETVEYCISFTKNVGLPLEPGSTYFI
jgi:hypothetical protein